MEYPFIVYRAALCEAVMWILLPLCLLVGYECRFQREKGKDLQSECVRLGYGSYVDGVFKLKKLKGGEK